MDKISEIVSLLKYGFNELNKKNYEQALSYSIKVLRLKKNIDALMLGGISLFKLGRYSESEGYLSLAYSLNPNNKVIQIYYLETLLNLSELDKGLSVLEEIRDKSIQLKSIELIFLERVGKYKEVIKKTINIEESIYKNEILAWNYERINEGKLAEKHANMVLVNNKSNFRSNIVMAKLFIRKNKILHAKEYLKKIQKEKLSITNITIYYSIKAQIFEKLGKYKKAFKTYTKSNNTLKKSAQYKQLSGTSYYTFEKIETINNFFKQNPTFDNLIESAEKIIFMVGFPRSGTTLLENILNAHSKIETIEEKPILDDILKEFLEKEESIEKLRSITNEDIVKLQNIYLEKRKSYYKTHKGIFIDKMPLNIIHIGIIYRIFPNAQFIISTRDIRDVALSCYFQNFGVNDAMANFLEWNSTKKYLQDIMKLGLDMVNKYPISYYLIEYKKLVENPFHEIKEILKFLGLEWEVNIENYRDNIIGKNINTPSYAKISKKINKNQINKWKNYSKKLFKSLKSQ